ncbi:MAG: hypothetical protein KF893_09945 [Caldilineaceae bacterium]|nr:hypothetical protein [Caldilineaceae bacterium]
MSAQKQSSGRDLDEAYQRVDALTWSQDEMQTGKPGYLKAVPQRPPVETVPDCAVYPALYGLSSSPNDLSQDSADATQDRCAIRWKMSSFASEEAKQNVPGVGIVSMSFPTRSTQSHCLCHARLGALESNCSANSENCVSNQAGSLGRLYACPIASPVYLYPPCVSPNYDRRAIEALQAISNTGGVAGIYLFIHYNANYELPRDVSMAAFGSST